VICSGASWAHPFLVISVFMFMCETDYQGNNQNSEPKELWRVYDKFDSSSGVTLNVLVTLNIPGYSWNMAFYIALHVSIYIWQGLGKPWYCIISRPFRIIHKLQDCKLIYSWGKRNIIYFEDWLAAFVHLYSHPPFLF
jgi:hypothetical protein